MKKLKTMAMAAMMATMTYSSAQANAAPAQTNAAPAQANAGGENYDTNRFNETFKVINPNYDTSPFTGMTRAHWVQAAKYLLNGAFSYIHCLDDQMYFPKQLDKTYPKDEGHVPTAKLEGLARTMMVAAPLLRENPMLTSNGVPVAEYYRYQLTQMLNPESKCFIPKRNGGASQILIEMGAIAMSMSVAKDALWTPLPQNVKDQLAALMLSYGDGPSIGSNWMFFNIFVMSFLKDQGYKVSENRMNEYLTKLLDRYRGEGWYNDAPAYDYYSQWAYQCYGPLWAEMYGKRWYPQLAEKFIKNQGDLIANYPYMFDSEGRMNMWGRSIPYRFASVTPLPLLEYTHHENVNYGWMRRIASSTLLQFLQHPQFLSNGVPTAGFYGEFAPVVQIYTCRGSVYWCGKAFLALLLPETARFWTEKENNGPWESEMKPDMVYNRFQPATNLMITDYPNSGAAEMRSWCHEKVKDDWQKFRSSENYNKLAYNTAFPWMADGKNGEISMNYGTRNGKGQWEVLRLYTFRDFTNGVYRRDAVLETDTMVKYCLADIPLPNGVLRVDRATVGKPTEICLGHYSLQKGKGDFMISKRTVGKRQAAIVGNGDYHLALIPLHGWNHEPEVITPRGLHAVTSTCALPMLKDSIDNHKITITLMLWKKGADFTDNELAPVKSFKIAKDGKSVDIIFADKKKKKVVFE